MSSQDSPSAEERIKYMEIRALIARKAAEIRVAVATLAELAIETSWQERDELRAELAQAKERIAKLKAAQPSIEPQAEHHKLDTDTQVFFYEQDFYVLSNFSSFQPISREWLTSPKYEAPSRRPLLRRSCRWLTGCARSARKATNGFA